MERPVFGHISRLREHPFKSAAGIDVPKTRMYLDGMGDDRRYAFALANAENGVHSIVTQREGFEGKTQYFAKLALIKPKYVDGGLELTWDGKDPIFVPNDYDRADQIVPVTYSRFESGDGKRFSGNIFLGSGQDPKLNTWVSEHVGAPLVVAKAGQAFERYVDSNFVEYPNKLRFQDGYTFSPHTLASVELLNQVAREVSKDPTLNIHEDSFRGNILWAASEPDQPAAQAYSEHLLHWVQMGEVVAELPKPSARCSITSVDPETGEVRKFQTLVAINKTRRWRNTKYGNVVATFAENGVPFNEGDLEVGMDVISLAYRAPKLIFGGIEVKPSRSE